MWPSSATKIGFPRSKRRATARPTSRRGTARTISGAVKPSSVVDFSAHTTPKHPSRNPRVRLQLSPRKMFRSEINKGNSKDHHWCVQAKQCVRLLRPYHAETPEQESKGQAATVAEEDA